jgi:phage terminase large subunit-like protein
MLETQMVSFNPDQMAQSPDRVDALVWGLSAALLTGYGAFVV